MGQIYDKEFYKAQVDGSLSSARSTLPELFRFIQPKSILDLGCGVGTWLSAASELADCKRLGVDGDYVNRQALMITDDLFLPFDLGRRGLVEAIKARSADRFDLVICIEVAEHLPFERAASLVDDICELGDCVLFSGAVPYQYGTGHINEQWPEFWAILFRNRGYACFDFLRPQLWGKSEVEWWYSQNLLVFAKEGSEAFAKLPIEAKSYDRPLAMIHPQAWLSTVLNLWFQYRSSARREEAEDLQALTKAWSIQAEQPPSLQALERAKGAPAGTKDVFPFTRSEVDYPERLLAEAAANQAEIQTANQIAMAELSAANEATLAKLNATHEAALMELRTLNEQIVLKLDASEAYLERVLSSKSWRFTKPLREIGKLSSKLRQRILS